MASLMGFARLAERLTQLAPTSPAKQLVGYVPAATYNRDERDRGDQADQQVHHGIKHEEHDDSADYDSADLEQAHDSAPFLLGHYR
jgi:hypothetical protein